MDKPYLLMAGDYDDKATPTGNWVRCFASYDEAKECVTHHASRSIYIGQWNVKLPNVPTTSMYADGWFDWVQIVDLRDWTNNSQNLIECG